jgi:hypothetical protein
MKGLRIRERKSQGCECLSFRANMTCMPIQHSALSVSFDPPEKQLQDDCIEQIYEKI